MTLDDLDELAHLVYQDSISHCDGPCSRGFHCDYHKGFRDGLDALVVTLGDDDG